MAGTDDQRAPVVLPQLRLDELLTELQGRISAVLSTRDRVAGLLDAVLAVGTGLDLQTVLRRIVSAAVTLVDAEYGALGVIGEEGVLVQFLTVGIDGPTRMEIGALPRGHGILGVLIDDPQPLRLDDLALHPQAAGFPPHHPPMHSFLGVPVRVRDEVFGNLYLTEKRSGTGFDEEDEQIVLALAVAAGVAIENARLYDTIRQRERWVTATAELSASLLSGASPDEALAVITGRARDLAGAEGAVVLTRQDGGGAFEIAAADGHLDLGLPGDVVRLDAGLVRRASLRDGEPVLLLGPDSEQLGTTSLGWAAVAPLSLDADGPALLVVGGSTSSTRPTPSLAGDVLAFAQRASMSLELADRRRDSERLVVFEDRDRIARDLHDLVIQRLFATGMKLESAVRLLSDEVAAERVHGAVDDLDATIKEIRSTIYALQSPPPTALNGARARLLEVLDAGAAQLGFAPSFRISPRLDAEVDATVARQLQAVLREALSNAARHAAADSVEVTVEVGHDGHVSLRVRDDGIGLPPDGRRSGLANLAERAERLGGSFTAQDAEDGRGTVLVWTAPGRVALGASST